MLYKPQAIASEESGLRCFPLKGYPPQRTAALLRRCNGYQSAAALPAGGKKLGYDPFPDI